jgi:UDP-GlcNAc:undecaprenyl-phosphate/decaprenyl-phosphate GlcNAc-1-phosphate transferase
MMRTWLAVLVASFLAARAGAEGTQILKTQRDKVNYAIGVGVARNFSRQGIEVDVDLVIRGMKDTLSGQKLLMPEDELRKTMNAFQLEVRQKQADLRRKNAQASGKLAETNKKAGDAFLIENKKKEGVVTLPSGLQYKILKAGDGKRATEADSVVCHYKGTLIDGTEFDSSYRNGQPATQEVKKVIAGWKEALQLMPVGSKWQLVVPPELAYKMRGVDSSIGPNATLVFEVELLAIK